MEKKSSTTYAFIPKRLEIQGRPELGCFSLNVLFGSATMKDGRPVRGYALYESDTTTYQVNGDESSLVYWNKYGRSDWLRITYDKVRVHWKGEKFVAGNSVGLAFGGKWEIFFAHFSGLGVTDGEHCEFSEPLEKNNTRDNLVSDKTEYLTLSWPAGKLHDTTFPYAIVRVAHGVFSPVAIPSEIKSDGDKFRWVAALAAEHKLRACFVLNELIGIYYNQKGEYEDTKTPPSGGSIVNWAAFLDGRIEKKSNEITTMFVAKNKKTSKPEIIMTKPEQTL